ncbi:FUSC family protein [Lacisediminihabitans changchengi]|uniref:FUSC family protein n=1 Tax=Lacisediminihabitans changchengi TaxID=2787634 RepID=A0A934SR00_9MICO|nr:FUSC family protein [Lacisediminihabitans changchengi]MBK4346559.1 FUSC family protein [Lacisediminihabitans changchengi]
MRPIASLRASSRSPLLQVVKTSIAAVVAWLACALLLNQPLPIFAAIAALLVVAPSVNQSLAKGVERSVGVIVGVLLAYAAADLFGNSTWVVLGIIVVALLLAWALRLSPGSANQIPISAMLVLALGLQTPGYAFDRIVETVIGAVIGLAVNVLVVPPVLFGPAHDAVTRLAEEIAATLSDLARILRTPTDSTGVEAVLERARTLRGLRETAAAGLDSAEESLTLNPRGGKHRRQLVRDRAFLDTLTVLATRVPGMARAVRDRYDVTLTADAVVQSIATELDRAAHDLLLLTRTPRGADEPPPVTAELPALTAPLVVLRPDEENWVLVGFLLEDLRRVRDEIVGDPD